MDLEGSSEIMGRGGEGSGWAANWLPDGRMLVTGAELTRVEPDGSRVRHADLSHLPPYGWSEMTVDGRGNVFVNSINFDFADFNEVIASGEAPGRIALVTPDGDAREVADGLAFPNGMVVTPDNATLIVAESFARRLTAFDIGADGSLSNRRVWADVTGDGISLDAEGAVWTTDVGPDDGGVCLRSGGWCGARQDRAGPPMLCVHAWWRERPDAVHGGTEVVRPGPDRRADQGEDGSDPGRACGRASCRLAVSVPTARGEALPAADESRWLRRSGR